MIESVISGKNIVLGISGGIAAYKSVELLRQLIKLGANVEVVMSKNATKFIGSMTFEVLSSNNVFLDLFKNQYGRKVPHIDLAEAADVVILAPATANIIAKIANGIADDTLSTFMLAVTCPVVICPSMNSNMYEHPATQRNLDQVAQYGHLVLSVNSGELACGVTGPGRFPEPSEIIDRLVSYLTHNDMATKRILITAGPTQELIDPVRFISNPSSGKMGYAIAKAAENRGAEVTLISGPVAIKSPMNVNLISVQSASEMANEVFKNLNFADIVVKVAAVSDYTPEQFVPHKIKKSQIKTTLKLKRTQDILAKIGLVRNKNQIIVGFAAETSHVALNAQKKLKEKQLDMVVANFIGSSDSGFFSDTNRVSLFFSNGDEENIDIMSKDSLAHVILDRILVLLKAIDKPV